MKKNGVVYEPAAIIAADEEDAGNDNSSSTTTKKHKKSKKSSPSKKKSKKQSYVMINEDLSEDDDDLSDQENEEININDDSQHTKHTNGSTMTALRIAEQSDDETEISDLEDIELNASPNNNTKHTQNGNTTPSKHNQNKKHHTYGTSAYYGLRLNYEHKKCHNIGWTIAFAIHCIAILVVLALVWTSDRVSMPHAQNGIYILLFLLLFAILFSFVWTLMLRYCGGFIVWILIAANRYVPYLSNNPFD